MHLITLQERAFAKLNLTLDVLRKREDGYHEIQSIMQQIRLCDDIEIDVGTEETWKVTADWDEVPSGYENLVWKAAEIFYGAIGRNPNGLSIRIKKRIPTQAGLGGGSADAAAVLKALNHYEGDLFTCDALAQLAADVGSDVPFCVYGGTALAMGRGEILSRLIAMPECFYCIVKPMFSVCTADIYQAVDHQEILHHPNHREMLTAIEEGNLLKVAGYLGNVMEPIVAVEHPELFEIRTIMEDCGALGVSMTGSGSAMFGVFDAFDMAAVASMRLMENYQTFLSCNA